MTALSFTFVQPLLKCRRSIYHLDLVQLHRRSFITILLNMFFSLLRSVYSSLHNINLHTFRNIVVFLIALIHSGSIERINGSSGFANCLAYVHSLVSIFFTRSFRYYIFLNPQQDTLSGPDLPLKPPFSKSANSFLTM